MATFKDNKGREWEVALDAPTIKKVREQFEGLDLAETSGKSLQRLEGDVILLVDVLYVICKDEHPEVDDIGFGKALVGDAIDDAVDALVEAIESFFRRDQREMVRAVRTKNKEIRKLGMEKALAKINDPNLQSRAIEGLSARIDAEIESAMTRLSSATSTQEPVESGPTD